MGMFDYVHVEVDLPDGFEGKVFQTKSFDRLMDDLRITKEGKLELLHFEMVEDGEWQPSWSDVSIPKWNRVNEEWVEWHNRRGETYHGVFNFYELSDDVWHEYEAKFTDGKLDSIRVVETGS